MKRLLLIVSATASLLLLGILGGCGGTRLDTRSVYANSTNSVLILETVNDQGKTTEQMLDQAGLPEQSPTNVAVFTTIPEFSYFVVDTFFTKFSYKKDSVTYKKIERGKHLDKLRKMAGKRGAKGIIVVFGDHERQTGGATNFDMLEDDAPLPNGMGGGSPVYRPGSLDVIHSDTMTEVRVKTYAIYYQS